ncbi:MAG: hypothetical protein ABIJ21_03560 [Nanoarchaeota archaeon]
MELSDWLKNYLRWKDQIDLRLKDIKVEGDLLTAMYSDKTVVYFCGKTLKDGLLENARGGKLNGFCVENSEENFQFLLRHWKECAAIPGLVFIFVNLSLGEKWIIFPGVHEKVADPDSLEQGLRAMFDLANGKVSEVKEKKKKQKLFEESEETDEDEE